MPNPTPLQLPPLSFSPKENIVWGNLQGSSMGLTLSTLLQTHSYPFVIITPDTLTASRLEDELRFFLPSTLTHSILSFPDWETLPYDHFSPHQDIISGRLGALHAIPRLQHGILITSISTLMHRLAPPLFLEQTLFLLNVGDSLDITHMRQRLEKAAYRCVEQVREHGEFAVRGAILDLYPMGSKLPYRIDLLDNEIDSIRTFSPETQRSLEKINKIELLPAKEFPFTPEAIELFQQQWREQFSGNPLHSPLYQDISEGICPPGIEYYLPLFFSQTATFFDYLPKQTIVISIEDTQQKAEEFWHELSYRYEQRAHDTTRPILAPKQLFIPVPDFLNHIQSYTHLTLYTQPIPEKLNHINFSTQSPPILNTHPSTEQLLQPLKTWLDEHPKQRILFCAETAGRQEILLSLFNKIQLHPQLYSSWEEFITQNTPYGLTIAPLDQGLILDHPAISLIVEAQLMGNRIMQRRRRKASTQDVDYIVKDLTELQIGAAVVHIEHGVGRYLGLKALDIGNNLGEYLHLQYADDIQLYIPVTSLHLISRYAGADPEHAPLHRLGTKQWERAKKKAAEQVRDIAAELLDLYAKRQAHGGFAFKKIEEEYASFAAAFPFEETPDQQKAIEDVLNDMCSEQPMDRLVCGDVGFGKTEVAMRATFIAAQNNKQVAVLVPTTLLAQQHYQTFIDRFAPWPIRIEVMSRFKSPQEQKNILLQLKEGKVDVVIGTHKLLQKTVEFKSLGLVVIDEEHRFGVQHKERLKSLRSNVDILTLTATPIPRTLNMAFASVRDLSIIATPPARRLSIKTFVYEYQSALIHEAISREILRGGQVYFLHNDVASISKFARDIEELVKEARVGIAHGQMRERDLEKIMGDFYHRRFNVLVCTTIIESGIDIPSANTIIINRADKLGLAQLHQLRGRVGRSHHQAYAYLFIPSHKTLTDDAKKRLDAISTYEELGVGFTLATHDLEIRGAGELLGEGQSGNMHAIGFNLYMELLSRSVEALKAGKEPEPELNLKNNTEIELQLPAFIPEHYLGDVHLRLECYKRIAHARTSEELDDIQVDMIDRFGLLPETARNLFAIQLIKQQAETLGIIKIEANSKGAKIEFNDKPNINPLLIIHLIQKQPAYFRLEGPTRLRCIFTPHAPQERLQLVNTVLGKLNSSDIPL